MKNGLEKTIAELPKSPGVYLYKDKQGRIIYVGKAANLRNRVRQYFQSSRPFDPKTKVLVSKIVDIQTIEVASEVDALFLEAELIKRYKPQFNIELRDDKSNLYIRIDIKSEHPVVGFTRRPLDDGAQYFGPYLSGPSIRKAMRILRRIFPYDTKKPIGKKANLDVHLGLSPGLQLGNVSLHEYRRGLKHLMSYLRGNRVQIVRELEIEMKQASGAKEFEKAAILRNRINALKQLSQRVVFSNEEFMDISKDHALNGLVELLGLKEAPWRIEGYDISHMGGTNNVASMVVFTNGLPDKTQYRKFKMRTPGNDDFAHMREVISRRFSPVNLGKWPKPDLLLIDGGKGQLSSAISELLEKNVFIPAIGLMKRHEEIVISRSYPQKARILQGSNPAKKEAYEIVALPPDSHVRKLLQRIRDESHRFALTYHSNLKQRAQTKNLLETIPGIGPATRKKLIKSFGSLIGVKHVSEPELTLLIGPAKARIIKTQLGDAKQ